MSFGMITLRFEEEASGGTERLSPEWEGDGVEERGDRKGDVDVESLDELESGYTEEDRGEGIEDEAEAGRSVLEPLQESGE